MKTEKEIEEMYSFIGFFNDGSFMNPDYRRGIMDALSFVLYDGQNLERIKRQVLTFNEEIQNKSEILKIIESGIEGDKTKLIAYTKLLVEKLNYDKKFQKAIIERINGKYKTKPILKLNKPKKEN